VAALDNLAFTAEELVEIDKHASIVRPSHGPIRAHLWDRSGGRCDRSKALLD
jgi:hypothetical protein